MSSESSLPVRTISFIRPDGSSTKKFSMEIADNDPTRRKGLMFRRELSPDAGMIFIFDQEKVNSFWMKNTYISLDMVFASTDKKVVGIISNVPPLSEESRSVGKPSKYVLEFAAGAMKESNVEVGSTVVFD